MTTAADAALGWLLLSSLAMGAVVAFAGSTWAIRRVYRWLVRHDRALTRLGVVFAILGLAYFAGHGSLALL